MNGIPVSVDIIRKISKVDELHNFIARLGYKTEPHTLSVPEFHLPESAERLLKELHIIADYDQRFQIYFGKITSIRRTDFRSVLEPFYRCYPQTNSLLFI